MEIINIVLVVVILFVLHMITSKKYSTEVEEDFYVDSEGVYSDDILNSWSVEEPKKQNDEKLLPNFLSIQFNNDYRDVITALNNLVPRKRQLFNLANIPVKYTEPDNVEVKNMIDDFVKVLQENVESQVPSVRNSNSGWDEAVKDPNTESGWDKLQKSLGLPTSLYKEPASKAPVKLITVKSVKKYETEDEIKFTVDFVVRKLNVEDQMIIRGSFVQDKRPLNDENNFFNTAVVDMNIVVEELFILGYLSSYGNDYKKQFDGENVQYYDYNKMEYNNMTDPKYIQKILMDKYNERSKEVEHRNSTLDEEGQAFHKQLPHVYDYSNIKGTRTIFDDMNTKKNFS